MEGGPLSFETEPVVKLANWFWRPFDNAVAAARTCYSPRVVTAEEVGRDEKARAQRDRIAQSIFQAGHHTTLQHATFQFILEKVSRQFLWSFLHAHPWYNSEQVSQRYVEVKAGNFAVPLLGQTPRAIYVSAVARQMAAYQKLSELLAPVVAAEYKKLFPSRDGEEKRWSGVIKKKAQEIARYVLPVATHAHLYHTISGITLHRYHRLCRQFDAPLEQQVVVEKMVEEVRRVDPEFFTVGEDPVPLEETVEYKLFHELNLSDHPASPDFLKEFDEDLGGLTSKLVDHKAEGERWMAQAVRSMLGLEREKLPDAEAIAWVMDPGKDRYLADSLNLRSMAKLPRAMVHPHFTFRKKLSHTADSQDQRHRMTPATRPVLARHVIPDRPDYVTPPLLRASPEAEALFHDTMRQTWQEISRLLSSGVSIEFALYLLPNAFPIRFEESGDLASFHHKWTLRLCYNAQEEIWASCRDEVLQVQKVYPEIGRWLGPPCFVRKRGANRPFCPEGDRFCGVRVWELGVADFQRVL